jgi:hypothetical protein
MPNPGEQSSALLSPATPRKEESAQLRGSLLHHVKNKCGQCQHPRLLHFDNKCSLCGCVAKRRAGNWQPKDVLRVYNAVVEGAKYYPEGLRLARLIYIVSLHNQQVYDYFYIDRYGRRVSYMRHEFYGNKTNHRYLRLRKLIINGKLPNVKIKALLPMLTVTFDGEGYL